MSKRALQPPFIAALLKIVDTKPWEARSDTGWSKTYRWLALFLAVAYFVFGVTGLMFGHGQRWTPILNLVFAAVWAAVAVFHFRKLSSGRKIDAP